MTTSSLTLTARERGRLVELILGEFLVVACGISTAVGSLFAIGWLFSGNWAFTWAFLASAFALLGWIAGFIMVVRGWATQRRIPVPVTPLVLAASSVVVAAITWAMPNVLLPFFWIVAVTAIGFSVGHLVQRRSWWLLAAGGLVVVAIVIAILAHGRLAQQAQADQAALETSLVRFEVTSDAGTAVRVEATTGSVLDEVTVFADVEDVALPWLHEASIEPPDPFQDWDLSATSAPGATTLSCRITVDGVVVAEEQGTEGILLDELTVQCHSAGVGDAR